MSKAITMIILLTSSVCAGQQDSLYSIYKGGEIIMDSVYSVNINKSQAHYPVIIQDGVVGENIFWSSAYVDSLFKDLYQRVNTLDSVAIKEDEQMTLTKTK